MTEIILFLDKITIHCSAIFLKFSERLQRLFTDFESIVVSLLFLRESQRSQKLMSGLRAPWRSVNNKKIKKIFFFEGKLQHEVRRYRAVTTPPILTNFLKQSSPQVQRVLFNIRVTCGSQNQHEVRVPTDEVMFSRFDFKALCKIYL